MFPFPTGGGGYPGGGFGGPGFGGAGFGMMNFEERYHAVPVAAADKTDTSRLEAGGKIMLPPSALHKLAQLEIAYPMLFEITNQVNGRKLHCGVLEFIASEGSALLPHWMMENLGVGHGDMVKIKSATLPKGTYVKLRPQSKTFLDIANPKAVLENTLRNFSALTKGETIRILYNKKEFDIDVIEVKPREAGAISIVDTDVNVDFDAPADYVEPVYKPPVKHAESFRDMEGEEAEPEMDSGGLKAFQGLGARPNGKAVQSDSSMLVDDAPAEKKSALQWKLRFDRFNGKQPSKDESCGGAEQGFKAFEGAGTSIRG
uniref:Ubiquitin fusion degradation protein n=2 Tax=Hemiselmis andersenii TaxID=464988 RepID=A0A6U2G3B6_HEMAN|mmetsp:Transcript_34689/g.81331  ORF Transcript_34689/g.81331 Transcript_34689/m.81331 type:complete len:316 (-) Transcript_34689:88-1035(-)